jgi:phosphoribosylformylglycinamidine synthase
MPRFKARVEVFLKAGYSDPEGETTRRSLADLNYNVSKVSVSKVYSIMMEARNSSEAKTIVDEMCRRLLVNPNKDDFRVIMQGLS